MFSGPLLRGENRISSFLHHNSLLGFTRPWRSEKSIPLPEIYRRLGDSPGAIVEYPVHDHWMQSVAVANYQRVHRRRVLVARNLAPWNHPELRLTAHVLATPAALTASPARFLILHRDSIAEERAMLKYLRPGASRNFIDAELLGRGVAAMEAELRRLWGAPDQDHEGVAVWDLQRIRSGRSRGVE